jgi:hypothetical protein
VNPEFTEITRIGADTGPLTGSANGWISDSGWQAYAERGASTSSPTAILEMPIRDGVYPVRPGPAGFVIFSYVQTTISQTVHNINLTGFNTITGVLNIVNVNNNIPDVSSFQIQYINSQGIAIYTTDTENFSPLPNWTDHTLTLTRAEFPDFDSIKSITVRITGEDIGSWGGQYGPAVDYCRLTIS